MVHPLWRLGIWFSRNSRSFSTLTFSSLPGRNLLALSAMVVLILLAFSLDASGNLHSEKRLTSSARNTLIQLAQTSLKSASPPIRSCRQSLDVLSILGDSSATSSEFQTLGCAVVIRTLSAGNVPPRDVSHALRVSKLLSCSLSDNHKATITSAYAKASSTSSVFQIYHAVMLWKMAPELLDNNALLDAADKLMSKIKNDPTPLEFGTALISLSSLPSKPKLDAEQLAGPLSNAVAALKHANTLDALTATSLITQGLLLSGSANQLFSDRAVTFSTMLFNGMLASVESGFYALSALEQIDAAGYPYIHTTKARLSSSASRFTFTAGRVLGGAASLTFTPPKGSEVKRMPGSEVEYSVTLPPSAATDGDVSFAVGWKYHSLSDSFAVSGAWGVQIECRNAYVQVSGGESKRVAKAYPDMWKGTVAVTSKSQTLTLGVEVHPQSLVEDVQQVSFMFSSSTDSSIAYYAVATLDVGSSNRFVAALPMHAALKEVFNNRVGTYEVTVSVGGSKLENMVTWELGRVALKLEIEAEPERTDRIPELRTPQPTGNLPEITHTFQMPAKRPALLVSYIFAGFIFLVLVIFALWGLTQLSFSNFGLPQMIFTGSLSFSLLLLVFFWISLNMFTLGYILIIVFPVMYLSGRACANSSVDRKRKVE